MFDLASFYILLANIIAIFHGLVVLLLLLVGPVALLLTKTRIVFLEWSFLVSGTLMVISYVFTGGCFLTFWEQDLRVAGGQPSYTGGFIQHYLGRAGIQLPDGATVIISAVAFIIGVIRIVILRKRERQTKATEA